MNRIMARAKGGTEERNVDINDVMVPDLWHVAMLLKEKGYQEAADAVLETWHLCHDLRKHVRLECGLPEFPNCTS